MTLTTVALVRLITNISISEVSDVDITSLIAEVTKKLMNKINVKVIRERILYIDNTRQNKIDGNNVTYYVKNWRGKFIGDMDGDSDVDTSDVDVFSVASDGTESSETISSITYDEGKFVLSSAASSSDKLYITYVYTRIDPVTPDPILELAATYLVSAYAYLKRDAGIDGTVKFGNVTINSKLSASFGVYHDLYLEQMKEILANITLKENWRSSNVRI